MGAAEVVAADAEVMAEPEAAVLEAALEAEEADGAVVACCLCSMAIGGGDKEGKGKERERSGWEV